MSKLTLYHDELSPPSRLALLVARNLDLDIEVKKVSVMAGDTKKPEFLAINPQHIVPTLVDHTANDFVLWESRAIATYLVESQKPGHHLYPGDVIKRAIINQRLYFDSNTLALRMQDCVFPIFFGHTTEIPREKQEKLYEAFGWLNGFLEINQYVADRNVTIADLAVLSTISGLLYLGARIDNYPFIQAWYEKCKCLKGFNENDDGAKKWNELFENKMTKGFY